MLIGYLKLYIGNDGFEFDEIGDGIDVSLINIEINNIEMEINMNHIFKAGFLYWLLSVSFPDSLRRLVFKLFVFFYLIKSL